MKVIEQYIVNTTWGYQILMKCEGDQWYITDRGAFGQRELSIIFIHPDEANKLLSPYKISQP